MRVLFSVLMPTVLKNFESVVRLLSARGHEVVLAVHQPRASIGANDLVDALVGLPRVRLLPPPAVDHHTRVRAAAVLRASLDYLQFLDPRFHAAYRARAEARVPAVTRRLAQSRVARGRAGRAALGATLRLAHSALPPSRELRAYVREIDPDVALFTPYIGLRTVQPDLLAAAKAERVATAVAVASWDNLTSKSLMRPLPERVVVWNETQRTEALELHGVPAGRITVTGAQCYDEWFEWEPRPREEFCERVGLDPGRPFVLYTCFTPFKGGRPESEFVLRWLSCLRESGDPRTAALGALVRPHPKRAAQWQEIDLAEFGNAVVWPRVARWPTDVESKADYFDSIYHSVAVVGLNTSAMLEAAVIGRPVLTVLADEYWESQEGTLHFRYLREVAGGLVRESRTLDEHERQLRQVVARPGADLRAFVRTFLRPAGLDVAATPIFVEAVESLARTHKGAPAMA